MKRILKLRIIELFDTQADFAQALGVAESVVSRVVRGRKTPTKDEEELWARMLKCERAALFPKYHHNET